MESPLSAADLGRICVISPHFDDAVLSASNLIAGCSDALVITVFSGGPARIDPLPVWDRDCGFARGDDVVSVRAGEDLAALACLGATGYGLGLWDAHYRAATPYWIPSMVARVIQRMNARRGPTAADIAALAKDLRSYKIETCAIPLGVTHRDHKLATEACLKLAGAMSTIRWLVYEDLPYSVESSEGRASAIAALEAAGFKLEQLALNLESDASADADPAPESGADRKRRALDCYPTQLKALGERADLSIATPERLHLLTRGAV